ncbi:MAG TPA: argininosuccinate lyase [Chthoniobacterales bacterium]
MWKGRFQQETAPVVQRFTESISFDWRLFRHDVQGSIAHAHALEKAHLLTAEERQRIEGGLREIEREIEAGTFLFRPELEDIHMNIEAALTERIGPAGAKLHTARSRNDQVALDLRLYLRTEIDAISGLVRGLQRALVGLARRSHGVIIPGYTHLQRAQPVLFGHHLLAYVEMLHRDGERIKDARKRGNVLPLGAGAIAGSTIKLDRDYVARQLEFPSVTRNSMDAVSDRDFAAETVFAIALLGVHLSRLSEDFILFASTEFHFLRISDAYSTGSSLMPQKKNPDVCELTRGKTGRLIGALTSLLTILKGLPMTYNRDLQEDKVPVFDAVDQIKLILEVYAGMVGEVVVDRERAMAAANDPALLATDLADYLVVRGLPFRQAHEAIGKLVAFSLQQGRGFPDLTLAEYRQFSDHFEEDVFGVLDLKRALESRTTTGAPSFANVDRELRRWEENLA